MALTPSGSVACSLVALPSVYVALPMLRLARLRLAGLVIILLVGRCGDEVVLCCSELANPLCCLCGGCSGLLGLVGASSASLETPTRESWPQLGPGELWGMPVSFFLPPPFALSLKRLPSEASLGGECARRAAEFENQVEIRNQT